MNNKKDTQTAVFRSKLKKLIELYSDYYPTIPVSQDIKDSMRFFADTYTIESRSE